MIFIRSIFKVFVLFDFLNELEINLLFSNLGVLLIILSDISLVANTLFNFAYWTTLDGTGVKL